MFSEFPVPILTPDSPVFRVADKARLNYFIVSINFPIPVQALNAAGIFEK